MNTDRAFEQHTDLTRALNRDGTPEQAWWSHNAAQRAARAGSEEFRGIAAFGDFDLILAATPDAGLRTHLITEFDPAHNYAVLRDEEGNTDLIGVVDPDEIDPEQRRITPGKPADAEQIAFPTHVLAQMTSWQVARAPTIYVTRDMVAMLEHAANSLDDTDLMPFHPAYPTGFAVLARPLRLPYGDGTDQIIRAIAWTTLGTVQTAFGTTGRAGLLYEFADRRDPDREVARCAATYPSKSAWQSAPDLVLTIADPFVTGTPVGGPVETLDQVNSRAAALAARIRDDETAARYVEANTIDPAAQERGEVGRAQPYLAALLLLLSQEITVTRTETANSFAVRRAAKAGRGEHQVTVVDVRRRDRHEPGERSHDSDRAPLHERHVVGGHWKWQPYGTERRLRKRIFVAAYVRGPDDAPLVAKPRVHRL